jgi:nitrogen fixation NifU-like protein
LGSSPVAIPEPQFDELYRELILDHYRRPRNRGRLEDATYRLEGINPVCGDEVHLDLLIANDRVEDVAFEAQGCSISQSSTSMLTDIIKGKSIEDAMRILRKFKAMMLEEAEPDPEIGDLEALQGVAKFPVRIKCAILSWNVLQEALEQAAPAA